MIGSGDGDAPALRVLCAGDEFISPTLLASAFRTEARAAGLPGAAALEIQEHRSSWPDTAFEAVAGVREAAGDVTAVAAAARSAHVILTHLAPITATVLDAAGPGLRLVGATRGGPVNIDIDAATARGVPVAFLPGRNVEAVAEFVVGVMIALMRNVAPAARGMAEGRWDGAYYRYDRCGPQLGTATVGLVGLGAVGLRVAALLQAFGSRVLAYDPFVDPARASASAVQLVTLPHLLGGADVVSVHARLTPGTIGMFDAAAFDRMRPGTYFVNTARGELVDQTALEAALASGHLAGAALDVFRPEPPTAADTLPTRHDVLATPHLAGASREVATGSAARLAAIAVEFLLSGRLDACANPEVLRQDPAARPQHLAR